MDRLDRSPYLVGAVEPVWAAAYSGFKDGEVNDICPGHLQVLLFLCRGAVRVPHAQQSLAPTPATPAQSTDVEGGSDFQRALVREIVSGTRPTSIRKIVLVPRTSRLTLETGAGQVAPDARAGLAHRGCVPRSARRRQGIRPQSPEDGDPTARRCLRSWEFLRRRPSRKTSRRRAEHSGRGAAISAEAGRAHDLPTRGVAVAATLEARTLRVSSTHRCRGFSCVGRSMG